jgi:hypothetical protein
MVNGARRAVLRADPLDKPRPLWYHKTEVVL